MTAYLVAYRDSLKDLSISAHADKDAAKAVGDLTPGSWTAIVVASEADLLPHSGLVLALFNALAPEGTPPVKRFETSEAGRRRLFLRIVDTKKTEPPQAVPEPKPVEVVKPAETIPETAPVAGTAAPGATEEADVAAKKKAARKTKAKTNGSTKRASGSGRINPDAHIEVLVDKNPKRPTAESHKRFELYRTGMKVSTFLEKGGTNADLSWDRAHKFIKITNP